MDGKRTTLSIESSLFGFRMTINEFKQCYLQINPNANIQQLDFDAERRCRTFVLSLSLDRHSLVGVFMMADVDRNGRKTEKQQRLSQ